MQRKSRLTITLPTDLLKRVDMMVDGISIRNRSHGVEQLIRQSLEPTLSTALILAGGAKWTSSYEPHPFLQKIQHKPLYVLMIDRLKRAGIRSFIIAAGANQPAFQKLLGDGSQHGIEIEYIKESKPLGTAGVLRAVSPLVKDSPCLVLNGDILTDLSIEDFVNFHRKQETLATIAVKPRFSERKYGQAFMQGNKIVTFLDSGAAEGISIVNTGIYLFEPPLFSLLKPSMKSIEKDVFPFLVKKGELSAFIFQGLWYDVSDITERTAAGQAWPI